MAMIALTAVLGFFSIVGAIIVAAFSRVLADEYKAWSPWLVERLIRRAVRKLPADMQERYREEWQSHVQEIPGEIGKLVTAFGFQVAANRINDKPIWLERFYASVILVMISPLLVAIALAIKLDGNSKIFKITWIDASKGEYETVFNTAGRVGVILERVGLQRLPRIMDALRGKASVSKPMMEIVSYLIGRLKRKLGL